MKQKLQDEITNNSILKGGQEAFGTRLEVKDNNPGRERETKSQFTEQTLSTL